MATTPYRTNSTKSDAFLRVLDARTGSLVDATPEYLELLRWELLDWVRKIDEEIAAVAKKAHLAAE